MAVGGSVPLACAVCCENIRAVARSDGFTSALAAAEPSDHSEIRLLWVRLGASEGLRDATLSRLRTRRTAEGSIVHLPMVRAQLTHALAEHLEIELLLRESDGPPRAVLHRRITEVDRHLLRCFGAEGYLGDSVGADIMASERSAYGVGMSNSIVSQFSSSSSGDLPTVRKIARDWAADFAKYGDFIDAEPSRADAIATLPGARWLATAGISEEYGGRSRWLDGVRLDGRTALERAVVLEELSRGDLGVLMASPGPSMSGLLVEALGDESQKQRYFETFVERTSWSCFALTEPDHGSDAGALETRVDVDNQGVRTISGSKRYVGGAARASTGVMFVRNAPGPLGIGAYIVNPALPGFCAEPLEMIGIRGAQICHIELDRMPVFIEDELGRSLKRSRRGLHGAITVFNQLRPGVAALAVGVAAAALDVIDSEWPCPPPPIRDRVTELHRRVALARQLTLRAALNVDRTGDGTLGSIAKYRACALAEEVTVDVADLIGEGARDIPKLERTICAARGIEFMEGTRNMQQINAFRGLDSGRVGGPDQQSVDRQC